jgi:hypothetical protein
MKYTYRIVIGRREGKRLLGRNRCTEEDIIKMYPNGIGSEVVNVQVKWRAIVSTVMNFRFP